MLNYASRALRTAALAGVAVAALAATPALAADTDTMAVSANVTSNCDVSASPIDFSNIDVTLGAAIDATGGISVTCTSGTAWSVSADAGEGIGASLAIRKMTSGANLLNYALFTDSGRTDVWGDGVETSATIDGTGSGVAQASTIYGRVLASQQSAPSGSYADSVTVTVTY